MEEFKPATPLLNFFDLDPERLKPMSYEATIDVPVAANGLGVSSVTIRNQPFILSRIKHRILGNTGDPETSGLYDDGQYLIEWRDEQRTYTNAPINADLLWGPRGMMGDYSPLVYPVYWAGTHTLDFRVTNQYTRVLTPQAEYFQVQIVLEGVADWGKLTPPR